MSFRKFLKEHYEKMFSQKPLDAKTQKKQLREIVVKFLKENGYPINDKDDTYPVVLDDVKLYVSTSSLFMRGIIEIDAVYRDKIFRIRNLYDLYEKMRYYFPDEFR